MNALRQIVSQFEGKILIEIPKEFKQKKFEVILLPIEDSFENETLKAQISLFLDSLPRIEPDISEAEIIAEIKSVRKINFGKLYSDIRRLV